MPYGKPRVDDRRVLIGINFVNRNGLRWSDKGIFAQMMVGLVADLSETRTVMIDVTYFKAQRTATSMGMKRGGAGLLIDRTKGGMKPKSDTP